MHHNNNHWQSEYLCDMYIHMGVFEPRYVVLVQCILQTILTDGPTHMEFISLSAVTLTILLSHCTSYEQIINCFKMYMTVHYSDSCDVNALVCSDVYDCVCIMFAHDVILRFQLSFEVAFS